MNHKQCQGAITLAGKTNGGRMSRRRDSKQQVVTEQQTADKTFQDRLNWKMNQNYERVQDEHGAAMEGWQATKDEPVNQIK